MARLFWLGVSHEFSVKCQGGLLSAEDFLRARRHTSEVTHLHGWQGGVSCCWASSFLHLKGLSTGLLECPHSMLVDFPRMWGRYWAGSLMAQSWKSHTMPSDLLYGSRRTVGLDRMLLQEVKIIRRLLGGYLPQKCCILYLISGGWGSSLVFER